MDLIDRRAVGAGAVVGVVVAGVMILLWQVVDALADVEDSPVVFLFYLVVVAGWVAAGVVAGRRSPDAPYSNGAVAALVAVVPVAVIGIVIALVRSDDVPVVEMVFNAMVATCAGIGGGLLAGRSTIR